MFVSFLVLSLCICIVFLFAFHLLLILVFIHLDILCFHCVTKVIITIITSAVQPAQALSHS